MKSVKYVILSTSLAICLILAGCSNNTNGTKGSEAISESLVGQVTEINGTEMQLTLGTLSELADMMGQEAPSGNIPSGGAGNGSAPSGDRPSDNAGNGEAPLGGGAMPSSIFTAGDETYTLTVTDESMIYNEATSSDEAETQASLADIQLNSILSIEFDSEGNLSKITLINAMSSMGIGGTQGQGVPGGGMSSGVDSYDSVTLYKEDTTVDGGTFRSTGTDENAILVQDGATVELNDITLERLSEDSTGGDNSSFYGVGAGLLVTDGTAYINGGTFTTDSAGGAGIFSYGDGVVYVADATIDTSNNTSGGIHVAGGGTLYAWNVTAKTDGASAAAIRSDRGSGTMVINGGTYTSNGSGSPAVYCTADISINDADLTATGSEAVCIEGLNSLRIFNSELTGNMPANDQNDCTWTIIIYQSMSGDSAVGNSVFDMVGGTINSENGGLLYTTNTECTITLKDVDINYSDSNEFFLMCTGNTNARGWGSSGNNGSDCLFTAISQEMEGDVVWDSISNLDFYMTEGSSLNGAFLDDETYAAGGGDGHANLYISSDSKWIVTKDSTLTNLFNAGTIVDTSGNTVSIVGADGTVYVKGTSDVSVTVTQYSDSADLSGATTADDFSDYAIDKPTHLQ